MRERIKKEFKILILASVSCLLIWCVVGANPIPAENITEMNELALRWPNGLSQPEKIKLIDYWGRYPFKFWTPEVKQLVEKRLDEYLPLIMACQEPSHAINFELHRWFRSIASDSQRHSMCSVLKQWLTDEISEAPPEGDMRLEGPESAVRREIIMARVAAAEVLADYGDSGAIALIETLIETIPSEYHQSNQMNMIRNESPEWLLEQALIRLKYPERGFLFRSNRNGEFELAKDLGLITHASFGLLTIRPSCKPMPIDSTTARMIINTLLDSHTDGRNVRSLWGLSFDVEFEDGRRAKIYLGSGRPELVYEDNMRVEHPSVSLLNEVLFDALEEMRTSKEYANWRESH